MAFKSRTLRVILRTRSLLNLGDSWQRLLRMMLMTLETSFTSTEKRGGTLTSETIADDCSTSMKIMI